MFKNMVVVLLVGICLLMSGCATVNPIQQKYQDLEVLYKSGKLTADEYTVAKQKIQFEELKKAQSMAQADNKEALHAKREQR